MLEGRTAGTLPIAGPKRYVYSRMRPPVQPSSRTGWLRAGAIAGLWGGTLSAVGSGALQTVSQGWLAAGMGRSALLDLRAAVLFWLPVGLAWGIGLAGVTTLAAPLLRRARARLGGAAYAALTGALCAVPVWRVVFGPWKLDHFEALYFTGRWSGNGAALAIAGGPALVAGWLLWRAARVPRAETPRVRSSGRPAVALGAACLPAVLATVAPSAWPAAGPGRPNIVLISLDTTRADRLGAYGYPRPTSPNLDRIAAEGIVFEDATTTAPWTLPAHMSLMTSLAPEEHGCIWWHTSLAPGAVTLAEVLREGGWASAAVTGGGYVLPRFGFHQGFDTYHAIDEEEDPRGETSVPREAIDWLARQPADRPFFLFAHTYRVHFPYLYDGFADASARAAFPQGVTMPIVEDVQAGRRTLSPEERRAVSDWYDGGVRAVDAAFGALFDALRARPDWDRTIVAVVADHGEQLWEHLPKICPEHGHSFHQEVIRVPFLLRLPDAVATARSGATARGLRITDPVSLVDVAPTLLDAAGCPIPAGFRGRSLMPLLRPGAPAPPPVFAASAEFGPDRVVVRDGPLKLIWTPEPGKLLRDIDIGPVPPIALYDLASDPGEAHDLSSERSDTVGRLKDLLRDHQRSFRPPFERRAPRRLVPLTDDERDRLQSLGYVN